MPSIFKSAILYFALVFGTGFALGTIRTLWVVPRLGVRYAELLEGPFMLFAMYIAAGWIVRRLPSSSTASTRLWVGFIALGLSVGTEILIGVFLMGLTVTTVFTHHDPVSGVAFLALLLVFTLMPWFRGKSVTS